jgi:hypothetical protein
MQNRKKAHTPTRIHTHHFSGLSVDGLEHLAVGAVAQLLGHLVPLHSRRLCTKEGLKICAGNSNNALEGMRGKTSSDWKFGKEKEMRFFCCFRYRRQKVSLHTSSVKCRLGGKSPSKGAFSGPFAGANRGTTQREAATTELPRSSLAALRPAVGHTAMCLTAARENSLTAAVVLRF